MSDAERVFKEIDNRGSWETRDVIRLEDMSSVGRLHLMLDGDSDVIVSVHEQTSDGLIGNSHNVEFCTIGIGGGGSPETYAALRNLMEAMARDNANKNWQHRNPTIPEQE